MHHKELPQGANIVFLFLIDLLQVDERVGQDRNESPAKEETKEVGKNSEEPLYAVDWYDIVPAQCELCQCPLI
eukprot:956773-Amphidinium_carterae.2